MSRVSLRLPETLKNRAEVAAAREGLSVNAWLIRAVQQTLDAGVRRDSPPRPFAPGRRVSGWVR
jgi:hypothetical protein